jgi:hypothetical protein
MTAETGILNRTGVALAADSAVTLTMSGTKKVYNSANKLFSLSKNHPVGIMIFGNASLMGVPWETIIKTFRKNVGDTKFDSLEEYCNEFFDFLSTDVRLVTEESETAQIKSVFHVYLFQLLNKVSDEITKIYGNTRPTEQQVNDIIREQVNQAIERSGEVPFANGFDNTHIQPFIEKHSNTIVEVIDAQINITLEEDIVHNIIEFASHTIYRDLYSDKVSGIVIAGYGEKEIFPSLHEFEIEGIFSDVLKFRKGAITKISAVGGEDGSTTAAIRPFAQKEMVHSFIEGVDPFLYSTMFRILGDVFNNYPEILEQSLTKKIDENEKEIIRNTGEQLLQLIDDEIEKVQGEKFVNPIIDIVNVLPKEELASMAEALVNLTSLKRKVTIDAETVGGPVDVAVISKGDGFIWIKRKHYFKPELNYPFFQNYMRGDKDD